MCRLRWISLISAVFLLITGHIPCAQSKINLNDHLQPIDVGINPIYDKLIDDGKLCSRNCTKFPQPRICYYKLVAEQYHTMGPACRNCTTNSEDCFGPQCVTANGIERSVLVFNRMLPGPAFHICEGDRVVVDLLNSMPARETTIHWHGQLQKHSPWEDGVPHVTQCPITSLSTFRYDFRADTSGTHFYHSHSALQVFDGLSGAFVVRTSAKVDPLSGLYDYDLFAHAIVIHDWHPQMISGDKYPGYNNYRFVIGMRPASYLVNGRGNYTYEIAGGKFNTTNTPVTEFHVKGGKKYRFRVVSSTATTCSYQFTIEKHSMLIIAADGYPVRPELVRALYMTSADIYDIVIDANQPPSAYWIRVQGYGEGCIGIQNAILRYEGAESSSPSPMSNTPALFDAIKDLPELNNNRIPCERIDNLCLDEMQSLQEAPERLLKGEPDRQFVFNAGGVEFIYAELFANHTYSRFYLPGGGRNGEFADSIDNMTNMYTPFALVNEPTNPMIKDMMCPKVCEKRLCECLRLIQLSVNDLVEITFIDRVSSPALMMEHPFHIHGHHWRIMKQSHSRPTSYFDRPVYHINVTNTHPVVRDSVPVPAGGYVVVRFIADNPGFWLLHCHSQDHHDGGMGMVFQIGELEQLPKVPENWPKCGDYLPPIH